MSDPNPSLTPKPTPPPQNPTRNKRWAVIGGVALGIIVLCFVNPFVGRRVARETKDDALSNSARSIGYGSKKVFARAGSTLVVSGDATIRRGLLYIRVWPDGLAPRPLGTNPVHTVVLRSSQSTAFTVTLPETSLYRIDISASPDGRYYDISYDVSWHVRP